MTRGAAYPLPLRRRAPAAAPAAGLLFFLLLVGSVSPLFAQRSIDSLCRIHGISGESDIVRIRDAYREAIASGIPEAEIEPFTEEILRHKLDCGQMVRVIRVSTRLRKEGLPYFVVFSKVREGVAKAASPGLVVEAAESKLSSLSESRDVLESLKTKGYRVRDFQNAAVVLSSYIEKGYTGPEIVSRIVDKGIQGAGFAALSGMIEKPSKRKER